MSTDQTTPPVSSTLPGPALPGPALPGPVLPGSAGSATDVDPAGDGVPDLTEGMAELHEDRIAEEREADLGATGSAAAPVDSDTSPLDRATLPVDSDTSVAEPARHPVGSSWQAEASGDLVAMSFPGARRIAGWLFWVVFPLLCIGTIHTSVTNVVHHLGNKPVGIRGTFVVQPRSCSQGFCSFGGLFSSDDGTIKNLPLLGDPRWRTAEVRKVTYDPRSVEVTPLPGHWNPTPTVMATIGALTYLAAIGYFLRQRRRSRQQSRSAKADRDPVPIG
jgi:hypothetical protein